MKPAPAPPPIPSFPRQLESPLGDTAMERLRFMPVQPEDLHHQAADALVAALKEHQDARPRAAQRAAQQTRGAQAQDLVQARAQGLAIRLVEAVLDRRREDGSRAG